MLFLPYSSQLLQRLDSCSESCHLVLQVLAVTNGSFGVSNLKSLIQQMEWHASFVTVKWRDQLLSDGLLETISSSNFCIQPLIREILCQRASAMNNYARIAKSASQSGYIYYDIESGSNIERLALYTGQVDLVRVALGTIKDNFAPQNTLPESYQNIAMTSVDMEWLATLNDDIQYQLLYHIVHQIIYGSHSSISLKEIRTFLEKHRSILVTATGACLLATIYLWRGDINRAERLLSPFQDGDVLALQGRIAWLRGDYHAALALYQSAIAQTRKISGGRNALLVNEDQAFYLLACLGSENIALLRQTIESMRRYKGLSLQSDNMFRWLTIILDVREQRRELDVNAIPSYIDKDVFLLFMVAIGLRWLGKISTMKGWFLNSIARVDGYAQYHEMDWMAWELSQIPERQHHHPNKKAVEFLQYLDKDSIPLPDHIHQRMQENCIRSCLNLLEQQEVWQMRLQALKSLRDDPVSQGAAGNSKRMAWLFLLNDQGICDVHPRIQGLNKSGRWSKGRKVALKRLCNRHERNDAFPFLTEQDQRICDCIDEHENYAYYAGGIVYEIDGYDALCEAAGHPCLFLNNMDTPLAISNKEVVLQVTQEDENICINIYPFPTNGVGGAKPFLQWEGSSQLTVYSFTEEQGHIANILGEDGLLVPKSAQSEALESIAAIAPMLTVHSAVEGAGEASAQEVAADARLHIHLQPAGDGLQINCFVRPFFDAPLLLRPGEGGHTVFTQHEGATLQTRRDLTQELQHAQLLSTACGYLDVDDGWHWRVDDPQQALETLDQLQGLNDETVILEWPEGTSITLVKKMELGQFRLSMHKQQDWFELDGEIQVDDNQVLGIKNLLALVKASPGRFIRLGEEQFLSLSNALYQRLDALQSVTDDGRFHGLAAGAIEEITDGMKVRKNRQWQDHLQRLSAAQAYTPQLPSTLQAELRDYQQEGFAWLARLTHWGAGACLADDMGLGKTVQALALMLLHAPNGPILVVAPTSVCMNWESEAIRFAPTLKLHNFAEGDRQAMIKDAGAFDVVICSYALLQRSAALLAGCEWQVVVLDEAQAIKNGLTKRSKAAMALQAKARIVTTGTPIENHLGELWNLFQFINPGLLGSLDSFNRRFANPIECDHDRVVAKRLKQLIHPFILRRLKSEVLTELPPRTEITIHVDLSSEEMALYEAARQRAMERIAESSDDQAGAKHLKVLAEIMRLRRACCHPSLIMPNSTIAGSKLAAFAECIDELREGNHKALVFSQFVGHLAILRSYLDEQRVPYQYLDGSTPAAQRKQRVDAFQAGEGDLFLISLKAGGSGLNLTAADFVLHMDPWWNPAVEDQASDRAHRIGQTRPVTIYRFIAKHTIEDKIVQLHQQKRDLADSLLEGSDGGGKMSLQDIMRLVEEESEEGRG
ncbi:MAG: DEAD/DEAH box helicase [Mariprofundales bacterium]